MSEQVPPLHYHNVAGRVRKLLLAWFEREGREFPWRSPDRSRSPEASGAIHDPYEILVAEVMLQQTQTSRVVEKLPAFLEQFPDIHALAAAPRSDVIRAWQGMGYNSRVLRLQETARAVIAEHGGVFPASVEELRALPGVGPYTASALACFAFGAHVPVVDVNVIRVLSRLFYKCHTVAQVMPETTVRVVAGAVVPEGDAYRWHQALMDLGAVVCTARRPACEICPLRAECLSAYPSIIELFDAKRAGKPEPQLRGEPRRLWRGRVVQLLRTAHAPLRVGEIYDRLFPLQLDVTGVERERREFVELIGGLIRDGLVVRAGGVYEGNVGEEDRISLSD